MTALSQLLHGANTEGWTVREIAAKAERAGHTVGAATVGNYMKGSHGRPTDKVLRAFAVVFRLDLTELRTAANLSRHINEATLPEEARQLSPRQWEAVVAVIKSMADPDGRAVQDEPAATEGEGEFGAIVSKARAKKQSTAVAQKKTGKKGA